jgi:hypothetical protein
LPWSRELRLSSHSHPWSYRTHVTRGSRCEPDSVFASPLHTQPRARSYACVSHSLTHAAASHEVLRHVSHSLTHAAASHEVLRHVSHSPMHAAASHEVLRHVSHSLTHEQLSTPRTRTAPHHGGSHLQSRMQSHGGRPSAATAAAAIAAVSATAAASRRGTSPSWPLPPALLPPLPPSQTQTPLCSWRLLALPLPLPALPLQRLLLLLPLPRPSLQRSTSPTHQHRWSAPSSTNAAWCLKSSIKIWAQPKVWHQMHCIHAQKDAIHDKASNLHCFIQTSQNNGSGACWISWLHLRAVDRSKFVDERRKTWRLRRSNARQHKAHKCRPSSLRTSLRKAQCACRMKRVRRGMSCEDVSLRKTFRSVFTLRHEISSYVTVSLLPQAAIGILAYLSKSPVLRPLRESKVCCGP